MEKKDIELEKLKEIKKMIFKEEFEENLKNSLKIRNDFEKAYKYVQNRKKK